jgi:hypothetical protein
MTVSPKRVLIIANEAIADPEADVPEFVRTQVREAEEVRVVVPRMTSAIHKWVSDLDAETAAADERLRELVGEIRDRVSRQPPSIEGQVGDEDALLAVGDALATFEADALILAVLAPEAASWRARDLGERVRQRFGLPVTEMRLDRGGRVVQVLVSMTTEPARDSRSVS